MRLFTTCRGCGRKIYLDVHADSRRDLAKSPRSKGKQQNTFHEKYGKGNAGLDGFALHSHKLGLTHPATKRDMIFQAPPPADMERVLEKLRSGSGVT